MRKIFLPLLLAIALLTGCGADNDSENVNSMKQTHTLVVGLDDHYAPMGFRNDKGELVGFDVDLAKEVGKRLGIVFEFKPIDWDKKREELESGNVDIIWNGTDVTEERKEYMTFSKPYMDNRQILLVKRGNIDRIRTVGDLEGRVVGTQAGSSSENYVNATPSLKNTFAAFKTYRNFVDAFKELDNGDVDVLICDEILARYEMSTIPPRFYIVEATVGPVTEIAIGFRKNDTELRDQVQKVFDEMIADGTAGKISEHWFQADLIKRRR
ncbi:MAG: amino acid ABC transporter substrate-binding protein [Quinella sp. 2Q5]|nr:amino acid ABC transporter substrate-binding protein [Quinella sp. 2Q5]